MEYHKWTKIEDDFLRGHYAVIRLKGCSEYLKLPIKLIKARVNYLKLKIKRNTIIPPKGYKLCSKCDTIKELQEFAKDGEGHRADCKTCNANQSRSYEKNHKGKVAIRKANYRKTHRQHINAYHRKLRKTPLYQAKLKAYQARPWVRIKINLRNRLGHVCRGRKSTSTQTLLGCAWKEFRTHIESKFQSGMSWSNYGQWHVDHIKPCSSFDLTTEAGQRACFHFTNLQPLWAVDNLKKGAS